MAAVQAELNRLAGTDGLGEALAAALWVGLPPSRGYSLQYCLNYEAGTSGLASQAAANIIANTNGLALAGALAEIPSP